MRFKLAKHDRNMACTKQNNNNDNNITCVTAQATCTIKSEVVICFLISCNETSEISIIAKKES